MSEQSENFHSDSEHLRKLEAYLVALSIPHDISRLRGYTSFNQYDGHVVQRAYEATDTLPDLLEVKFVRSFLRTNPNPLLRRWAKIRFWLMDLVMNFSSKDEVIKSLIPRFDSFKSPEAVVCRLLNTLLVGFEIPVLTDLIVNDKEITNFLIAVNLSQGKRYGQVSTEDECKAWREEFTVYPMMALSASMNYQCRSHPERVLDWKKRKFTAVAVTTLQNLRNAVRVSSNDPNILACPAITFMVCTKFINDLLFMSKSVSPTLLRSAMPTFAQVLRYVLDAPYSIRCIDAERLQLFADICTSSSIPFVKFFATQRPSLRQVRRLIGMGVLELCADVCTLESKVPLSRKALKTFICIMAKVQSSLISYMCHYSVAGAAQKRLAQFSPTQTTFARCDSGAVYSWPSAIEFMIQKHLYDATRKIERHRCDNCHTVQTKQKSLKVCGGCKSQRYCSTECQRKAWNEGSHRLSCRDLKEPTTYVNDVEFFAHLAANDVRYAFPGIRLLARKSRAGVHISNLAVIVDYTPRGGMSSPLGQTYQYRPPPTISVASVGKLDDAVKRYHSTCQTDGLQFILVRFQGGSKVVSLAVGVKMETSSYGRSSPALSHDKPSIRSRRGISRPLRFSMMDRETPTLKAVEWDDIDEVWSRALRSEIPLWEAIEVEAQKLAIEKVQSYGHKDVTILGHLKMET